MFSLLPSGCFSFAVFVRSSRRRRCVQCRRTGGHPGCCEETCVDEELSAQPGHQGWISSNARKQPVFSLELPSVALGCCFFFQKHLLFIPLCSPFTQHTKQVLTAPSTRSKHTLIHPAEVRSTYFPQTLLPCTPTYVGLYHYYHCTFSCCSAHSFSILPHQGKTRSRRGKQKGGAAGTYIHNPREINRRIVAAKCFGWPVEVRSPLAGSNGKLFPALTLETHH